MNKDLKFQSFNKYCFEISETSVQDIDNEDDWEMDENPEGARPLELFNRFALIT